MDDPPTAIFAHNDLYAVQLMHALMVLGLRIPDKMSIVGLDHLPYTVPPTPPLTTAAIPLAEVGRIAAELCLNLINGEEPGLKGGAVFQPELIVGGTTGPPGTPQRPATS